MGRLSVIRMLKGRRKGAEEMKAERWQQRELRPTLLAMEMVRGHDSGRADVSRSWSGKIEDSFLELPGGTSPLTA